VGQRWELLDPKTGAVVLDSPQNLEALNTMVTFVKKKTVQPGVVSMDLDVGRQIFTNGNAVYHRNWNYATPSRRPTPACRQDRRDQYPALPRPFHRELRRRLAVCGE